MDPVTLIVAALIAGATSGLSNSASSTVSDTYGFLKKALAQRFKGTASAEVALVEYEADPEIWKSPLTKSVRDSGVAADQAVLEAAQRILAVVDAPGTKAGKYVVDVSSSSGVVIGDHANVTQTFGSPRIES